MSLSDQLLVLEGEWMGVNHLWLSPDSEEIVTEAGARVEPQANGSFLSVHYTWVYADVIQEGLLLIGGDLTGGKVSAAWLDSWHYAEKMMACEGKCNEDGSLTVVGSYAAPEGPDWGWWLTLQPLNMNQFKLLMHNVPPGEQPALAVECLFERLT